MAFVKRAVSKKKRRYIEAGFDLDLSYITDRVIAMGFPSQNMEGMYRNSMTQVLKFLDQFHADHYRVYNLCTERSYDPAKFHDRVARFPFDDHNPPPLSMIQPFCEDIENWFRAHDENIAVIHCKAGKGRTGLMIACWLLYCRMWPTANEALAYYGAARTQDQKGVTIASQKRYVNYFQTVVEEGGMRSTEMVILNRVRITHKPTKAKDVYFVIKMRKKQFISTALSVKGTATGYLEWDISAPLLDDCLLVFYEKKKMSADEKLFQMWFHCSYVEDGLLIVPKMQIDKACKDKKHKVYNIDMKIELYFDTPIPPTKPAQGSRFGTDTLTDAVIEEAMDGTGNVASASESDDDEEEDEAGGSVGGKGASAPSTPASSTGKGKDVNNDSDSN